MGRRAPSVVVAGVLRAALPLVLGLCLGCSLSLLRVSWIPSDEDLCASGSQPLPGQDDVTPRILPYVRRARAPHRKVLRTRYIQTELGFRERLLVVVLSSRSTLASLGVAVNRTLGPHVSRLLFVSGARISKALPGMEVVCHGDERPAWMMYNTLRHLEAHLSSAYDWIYVTQDDAYTNGFLLRDLVSHLSPAPPVYIGTPAEFIGGQEGWRYCHGGAGYLLSRALLLSLRPHLDVCRSDILGSHADEWLGRCLQDTLGIACAAQYKDLRYTSIALPRNAAVEAIDEGSLAASVSVYPLRDPGLVYKLHGILSQIQLQRTYLQIQHLQGEIQNLSTLTPNGEGLSWPIGVNAPFRATSRYDVLAWEYFTETHAFSCADGSPKCPLQGAWRLDVQQVLADAVDHLNQRYQPWVGFTLRRLVNGYRRFDPTRGMEYVLDLLLEATTERGRVEVMSRRLHLLRPLGLVEILPMPYVTEATRVHVVLPLVPADAGHVAGFLDAFATNLLDPQENVALSVLLVYDSSGAEDVFEEVRGMISELERRYSYLRLELASIRGAAPSQVAFLDLVSKTHAVDALFFLVGARSQVTLEALNRCRMNTISGWQVFSPVHYQEYSPEVTRSSAPPGDGHFDRRSSWEFCLYNADFMAARAGMSGDEDELLELFLRHSELHVFRAVEPALVHRFSLRRCSTHLSGDGYHRCVLSSLEALGSRTHLAMALLHQEQTNST